ncbi:MAG: diheme cytochrome c-553 [bacterium]|nr:MAG: diheme cytochrome c-553 [bacterium]
MRPKIVFISLGLVFLTSLVYLGLSQTHKEKDNKQNLVKRGEYLVTIGGCNDCHTPKVFMEMGFEFDTKRLLSGHPSGTKLPPLEPEMLKPGNWLLFNDHLTVAVGPWGMTYAANLTPDEQTGIGLWKEENFIKALKTGKHMGAGRPIMPPMPWMNLAHASEEDLAAIFAYLQSLPPVNNSVPAPVPPDALFQ